MKKLLISIFVILTSTILFGCELADFDVITYHNNLVDLQDEAAVCLDDLNKYVSITSIVKESLDIVEEKRMETLKCTQDVRKRLENKPGFQGDESLKEGIISIVDAMIYDAEYYTKEILTIWYKWDSLYGEYSTIPESEIILIEQMRADSILAQAEAYKKLEKVQKIFSKKHDIDIEAEEEFSGANIDNLFD